MVVNQYEITTRRQLLRVAGTVGLVSTAGCPGGGSTATSTSTTGDPKTAVDTPTDQGTETNTDTPSATQTPRENPETIFVDAAAGNDDAAGTSDDPLRTIQFALDIASPGETVHVRPGEYCEVVRTNHGGEPGKPITLTGPPDAVFRGNPDKWDHSQGLHLEHSHIHIRGLTFNGLSKPEAPDSADSYVKRLITVRHTSEPDGYLQDFIIKPHAVGNALRILIGLSYCKHVEIGEFEVIGPAGLAMLKFGNDRDHNGEIVYLGTAPTVLETSRQADFFDGKPDFSNDIHVHHIDNSAGHPHAELVDVKAGCHDVLIEYCTDAGGAGRYTLPSNSETSETSIHLSGRDTTLRWNVIENSNGQGVEVGSWDVAHKERFEELKGLPFPEELSDSGRSNSVYGNRITDCAGLAIRYPVVYTASGSEQIAEGYGPDEQEIICGNEIEGETHGSPAASCPSSVPTTDAIGHTGGRTG